MREVVQTALQHQQHQLTGDLEKSRAYYESAREMAGLPFAWEKQRQRCEPARAGVLTERGDEHRDLRREVDR